MDAITGLSIQYAGGTGVYEIDDTSDWSIAFLDLESFLVGVLLPFSLSLLLAGDLSFPLDLEADLPDLPDFYDLSYSSFFGLSLLFLLF